MKKNTALVMAVLLLGVSVAACQNTVHGAGKDIENAGESVQQNVPPKR